MNTRTTILALALFSACAAATPPDGASGSPIKTYLESSAKTVELEGVLARYDTGDTKAATNATLAEARTMLDAAHAAAAGSKDSQEALDAHWLVLNRCLDAGVRGQQKIRLLSECSGDLAEAKAKVELVWSRHKP